MYEASNLLKSAIVQKNRELSIRCTIDGVVYTDSNIKSCSIEESILTGEDFKFGSATSSNVTIILINVDGSMSASSFEGKELLIEIGIKVNKFGSPIEYATLGTYIVETGTKDLTTITLNCVDKMIYFEKPYVSNLTYPATLQQIIQEICNQVGIPLATTTFLNYDFLVTSEPDYTNVTLRNALEYISELACSYAGINRDGNLELFTLIDTDIVINRDNYYSMNLSEYMYGPINQVAINNDGVLMTSGTGENTYTIANNIFALYPTQSLVDNIYNKINNFSFKPFNCVWQGNPLVSAGDIVTVNYNDGPDYKSFIANQKFTYETGLKCEVTTNAKPLLKTNYPSGGIIIGEIGKARSEFKSQISQTNDNITLQVSRLDDDIATANAAIQLNADNIALKVDETDFNGNTIAALINLSSTTIDIEASKINLRGAVTVLSDITGDLGSITAGTITIDTALTVGDTINVGSPNSGNMKSIIFANNTYIQAPNDGLYLQADPYDYIGIHPGSLDFYVDGYSISLKRGDTPGHVFLQAGLSGIQILGYTTPGIQARNSANSAYAAMYATAFTVSSDRNVKKNIKPFTENASDLISTTPIYNYNYQDELDSEFPHTGVILDESPVWIADITGQGVDTYGMVALAWKSIQEILSRVSTLETKVS
jgi:trimeric autotransporter adhesin